MDQKFPVPRTEDLLARLQDSAADPSYNVSDPFSQIVIHPYNTHKIAFPTRARKSGNGGMLLGIVNASSNLVQQVNNCFFAQITGVWMVMYTRNALMLYTNVQEHLLQVRRAKACQ